MGSDSHRQDLGVTNYDEMFDEIDGSQSPQMVKHWAMKALR